MNPPRLGTLRFSVITIGICLGLTGCPKEGPAQRAGEKIDKAKDKVSDTVNPKGPAEKAGRSIDRALDK